MKFLFLFRLIVICLLYSAQRRTGWARVVLHKLVKKEVNKQDGDGQSSGSELFVFQLGSFRKLRLSNSKRRPLPHITCGYGARIETFQSAGSELFGTSIIIPRV